ncbi:MAG: hypothetical protein OXH31_08775 [Gammaproteobacteria bacterium]|nr:hypothetical protein [Gammaproteobacteria bacterium]
MTSEQSKSISQLSLLIGVSFAVGLVFGALAVFSIQFLKPQNEQSTRDVANRESRQTSISSTDVARLEDSIEVGQFQEIFKHHSISKQYTVLHSTLSRATAQELKDWWQQSHKIERDIHRRIAQSAILQNVTVKNPPQALRYIEDVSTFKAEALLMMVFFQWSVSNLEEAVEAVRTLAGRQRDVALQAILEMRDDLSESQRRSIATQLGEEETFLKLLSDRKASESITDPEESWNILLNDEVDDYLQMHSLAIVAKEWYEHKGFEVLSSMFTEISDYWILEYSVAAIAQTDPAGALNYTRTLGGGLERTELSRIIVAEWARVDSPAALKAANSMEPASLSAILEREITDVWARSTPDAVIENIQLVSQETRLRALENAFSHIARKKPSEAFAKLSAVERYVGGTSTIVRRIVSEWAFQQPDTAADWVLRNYSPDDPERRALIARVVSHLAHKDPHRAFELATAHPSPSGGRGLEEFVIDVIAREGDFEVAKNLLPNLKGDSRRDACVQVGRAMVDQGQYREAVELGKDLPEVNHFYYYDQILNSWAGKKPTVLYDSLENLPTSNIKSRAAFHLLWRNTREPVLSDEQITKARTLLRPRERKSIEIIENR